MKRKMQRRKNRFFSSVLAIILCLSMVAEPVMATDGSGTGEGSAADVKLGEDILKGAGAFDYDKDTFTVTTASETGWTWNKTAQAGTAELVEDEDPANAPLCKYLKGSSSSEVQPVIKYGEYMFLCLCK